jgi:hypothetical protein
MSKGTAKMRAVVMEFGRFTTGSMRQAEGKSKGDIFDFKFQIFDFKTVRLARLPRRLIACSYA